MWATLWSWIETSGIVLIYAVMLSINFGGVVLVALQLPGTWLILAATALVALLRNDADAIGWWTLGALLLLCILGELVEFFASAAGASKAGATKTGIALSIVGGLIGAIAGTFLIPVPILGTLLGAAIGAGLGTLSGDLMRGREIGAAWLGARGAAVGKFWGALGKVVVAVVMWGITLLAVLLP